jgi:hypothetical protein
LEGRVSQFVEIENGAGISRVTCGWKLKHLSLEDVRPYWRDAHSPAIARREGLYEYRHYPLDPIRTDLFAPVEGIDLAGKPDEQLMWLSDVRYRDEAGMDAFGASPPAAEKGKILGDIEMIVDKSTTYKVVGDNARTLADTTGDPAPAGDAAHPTYEVFFRQRGEEATFRDAIRAVAKRWAATPGVIRVRLNLFEVPDMEAERKAGYPVKTHPLEMQYQAWIDLVTEDEAALHGTLAAEAGLGEHVAAAHAYPAPAVYTFNWNGRATLAGLRGYAAVSAIRSLDAKHQKDPGLLEWMYGDVARGGASA